MSVTFTLAGGTAALDPAGWDALDTEDNPFLSHAFLRLLETSGSVGPGTGWEPRFVLAHQGAELVGGAPVYLRHDSYGEYVFDWGWAQAAARAGIPYYPKLTCAVPFTPANGPRLLVKPGHDKETVWHALLDGISALEQSEGAHSSHLLLCTDAEADFAARHGFVRRATHQFHFHNPGYRDYEAFLAALRSPARKQLKKERSKAQSAGLRIETVTGRALDTKDWARLYALYVHTSGRKWGRPYLTEAFFTGCRAALGDSAVVVTARDAAGDIVAMSLSFERGRKLFGRYWGAVVEVDSLHFELCYHRLLDRAFTRDLTLVEAGAQGEHKLKRGFLPAITHSAHRLRHPGLFAAVQRAVLAEREELLAALADLRAQGPFRA